MTVAQDGALVRTRPAAVPLVAASAVMAGLAGIAWWWTIGESGAMSSMAMGLAQIGRAMTFDMAPAAFLGMWATMMVAMMMPSIASPTLAYAQGRRAIAIAGAFVAFLTVYFAVWAVTGVPALIALTALSHAGHASAWLDRVGGVMLVVAGAYQFTGPKRASLRACRISFRTDTGDGAGPAVGAAAEAGVGRGLSCLRCCWALIAVLLVVGVMNLAWMAVITLVCLGETSRRYGTAVATSAGVALLGLGVAVLLHPPLLSALA